jgi:hypothetical protein
LGDLKEYDVIAQEIGGISSCVQPKALFATPLCEKYLCHAERD